MSYISPSNSSLLEPPSKVEVETAYNESKPRLISTKVNNPTENLKKLCIQFHDEPSHFIKCIPFTRGGFGDIKRCKLYCGNNIITEIVIKKEYTYTKPNYKFDNEFSFMYKYCSDAKNNKFFSQLLFWNVDENIKKIELGIKKYTCSLDPSSTYKIIPTINYHIISIHERVITNISKLHKLHRVHLDIKPGNILIDYDKNTNNIDDVVLADFGLVHKISGPNFNSLEDIRVLEGGTPMIWLPPPTKKLEIEKLKEFAKFRDIWAWSISLCYLLKYYNDNNNFVWIYRLLDPIRYTYIEHRFHIYINEFISSKKIIIDSIQFLNSKKENSHNEMIINYIINTILRLPEFYIQDTQYGGINMKVKYNDKIYKVYRNKQKEKYINVNKSKILLASIRRQYRYIKN